MAEQCQYFFTRANAVTRVILISRISKQDSLSKTSQVVIDCNQGLIWHALLTQLSSQCVSYLPGRMYKADSLALSGKTASFPCLAFFLSFSTNWSVM